jgi:hypothetical protein
MCILFICIVELSSGIQYKVLIKYILSSEFEEEMRKPIVFYVMYLPFVCYGLFVRYNARMHSHVLQRQTSCTNTK